MLGGLPWRRAGAAIIALLLGCAVSGVSAEACAWLLRWEPQSAFWIPVNAVGFFIATGGAFGGIFGGIFAAACILYRSL